MMGGWGGGVRNTLLLMSKLRFFKLGLMPQALFFFSINTFFNVKSDLNVKHVFFQSGLMPQALFFPVTYKKMRLVARINSDQVSSKTDVTTSSYEGFKFCI